LTTCAFRAPAFTVGAARTKLTEEGMEKQARFNLVYAIVAALVIAPSASAQSPS